MTTSALLPLHQRPSWRGRLHVAGFFATLPLGWALPAAAPDSTARVAVTVSVVTLLGGFGVSAAYHRVDWSPPIRLRMQVLDHSMTFVVMIGAAIGVLLKLATFHRLRWLGQKCRGRTMA